jgi:TRAP-type C4-dicarboxylate transport system permease small subunit
MEKLIIRYEATLEKWGVFLISAPLAVMTVIEVLNAVGRKLSMPFPCALESVESLLVISVYLGVAIVALEGGHVNVTLMTNRLSPSVQSALDALANLLGALTFGFFAVAAWVEGVKSVTILEMRIGMYRFPIWPFKIIFAFGLTLLVVQLAVNVVKYTYNALGYTDYAGSSKFKSEVGMPL